MIKNENVIIVRQPYTNFNYPTNVTRTTQLGCYSDKGCATVNLKYDKNSYSLGETVNAHIVINNSMSKVPSTCSELQIVQELCLQKPGTKGITKTRVILREPKVEQIKWERPYQIIKYNLVFCEYDITNIIYGY